MTMNDAGTPVTVTEAEARTVALGARRHPAVLLIAIALVTAGCGALAPRMSLAQDRVVAQ
jgi:hypothetical protein